MTQFLQRQWQNIILGAFILLIILFLLFKSWLFAPTVGEALAAPVGLQVRAVAIPLNEEDPGQATVGALSYVAGWALTADQGRFGGFSGLQISGAGGFTAINDLGTWWTGTLDLAGVAEGRFSLTGATLSPYANRTADHDNEKEAFDAEGLVRFGDRFLVSFEHDHRVRISAPGKQDMPWPGAQFIDFGSLAPNSGLESLTWVQDGTLLTFAERGLDVDGHIGGWLVTQSGSDRLYLKPPKNFVPTDAATLPNGDVLLLMRRFSVLDGVAVKILRLKADNIRPGAELVGEELAHLAPPLAVDNLEGLDVHALPGGQTRLFILSDDNFNDAQRTLFLVFDLAS